MGDFAIVVQDNSKRLWTDLDQIIRVYIGLGQIGSILNTQAGRCTNPRGLILLRPIPFDVRRPNSA